MAPLEREESRTRNVVHSGQSALAVNSEEGGTLVQARNRGHREQNNPVKPGTILEPVGAAAADRPLGSPVFCRARPLLSSGSAEDLRGVLSRLLRCSKVESCDRANKSSPQRKPSGHHRAQRPERRPRHASWGSPS